MTTAAGEGADLPTPRRALPRVFDVLFVLLVVQAHLYALVVHGPAWSPGSAMLPLWALSLAVPLGALALARRHGGTITGRAFAGCCAMLLGVDVASVLLVPAGDPGAGGWQWGAIGVTALAFAALRPARDVLALAAAHTGTGIAVGALGDADGFALLATASATATPALVAAQYLALHVAAVRAREDAVADRRETQVREEALVAVRADRATRLAALQSDLLPLLRGVADGSVPVDDEHVAARARRLGDDLRRELVEARSGRWLLPVDRSGAWPGLLVLDPTRELEALELPARTALLDLVDSLRRHEGLDEVVLATSRDAAGLAVLTVVAGGEAAARAGGDPRLREAANRLGGSVAGEDGSVVVDAHPAAVGGRLAAWGTGMP